MAIFRLQITSIARTMSRGAPAAAAYRAGEKIRDDRTGKLHNHARRTDVTHKEIMLPAHLNGQSMDWAKDRASLWNTVERAEKRIDARVAREILVTLPAELPAERRLQMARTFSREVADHYKVAVDLAVHDPRPSGDARNFHAHLLLTTREVTPTGLAAKIGLDMNARDRVKFALPNLSREYTAIRERWATITNEALKEANLEARVDHRSLAAQGIDREPRPHFPFAAIAAERAGQRSEVAEDIRGRYDERVRERQERSQKATAREAVPETPKSLEDIRREARENWLRMRAAQTGQQEPQPDQHKDHGADDDHLP
jgi:ATP-dependent exoDNAse (exonuclease V) alpha subunit